MKKYPSLREFQNVKERRNYLEKRLNVKLKNIGYFSLDEKAASVKNCENMIGVAQIPLGIAGPIKIRGANMKENFFLPLATTEAALVASVNRGCKAISLSGGANTGAVRIGATRGPVFYTGSLEKTQRFRKWIEKNEEKLKKISSKTDPYLKLTKLETDGPANYVFLRFYFDTFDAMGMNMATIASQKIAEVIEKETKIKCLAIAGNFDVDKKPAWLNFIKKRGFEAWAEVVVSEKVLKEILKTSAKEIFDVWLAKSMIGSAMSGSMGFNGHFANIIAALFIATGQDPAHTVDGSLGITTAEVREKNQLFRAVARNKVLEPAAASERFLFRALARNKTLEQSERSLYFSVYLPDLMLGTIGGGTNLATQKEALEILGVSSGNNGENSLKFSQIVAAAVLAGELSLLSSLAEGSLAKAHLKLARGKATEK